MSDLKSRRGGARPGAGRKATTITGDARVEVSWSIDPVVVMQLKARAEREGIAVSRLVESLLFKALVR